MFISYCFAIMSILQLRFSSKVSGRARLSWWRYTCIYPGTNGDVIQISLMIDMRPVYLPVTLRFFWGKPTLFKGESPSLHVTNLGLMPWCKIIYDEGGNTQMPPQLTSICALVIRCTWYQTTTLNSLFAIWRSHYSSTCTYIFMWVVRHIEKSH